MKHLVASVPLVPIFEDPGATNFVTGSYCLRSSIQLIKEHMDTELQGLPPLTQPPLYTLVYGTDDPLLPSSKSCPGYLKQLSLVPSFEPPIVYSMTETIPAQTALTREAIGRGQPSTPWQLGTYDPMEPAFSDMLRRREARQPALGHPPPPHLPEVPGGGPLG